MTEDPSSHRQWWTTRIQKLRRTLRRHARNQHDADDAIQTVLLRYIEVPREDQVLDPEGYLYQSAVNELRSRERSSRREHAHFSKIRAGDSEFEITERAAECEWDYARLVRCLSELPEKEVAALIMKRLEGRTLEDIASTLSVSISTVKTLISKAEERLRRKLNDLA